MKKMILVLALLGFSAAAQAGDYARAASIQSTCSWAGEEAGEANRMRRKGMTRKALEKRDAAYIDYQVKTRDTLYSYRLSDQDAYMAGWADCMDSYAN